LEGRDHSFQVQWSRKSGSGSHFFYFPFHPYGVSVCEDADKAGGAGDGAVGGVGAGGSKGVPVAGHCRHAVGVCEDGDGHCKNTLWAYDKMRRRPGETSEPSGMIQQSVLKSCSMSLRNHLAPPLFSWLLVGRSEFF
jgi:hypothetical protein